jgi:comEA protein
MKKWVKAEIAAAALGALFIAGAIGWAAGASSDGVRTQYAAESAAIMTGADGEDSDELAPGEVININTAGQAELEKLPGIGAELAKRIIEYRQANGAFVLPEDIMNVEGIGQAKYDAVKGSITT